MIEKTKKRELALLIAVCSITMLSQQCSH